MMNYRRSFLFTLMTLTLSLSGAVSPRAAAQSSSLQSSNLGAPMPNTSKDVIIRRFYEQCLNQHHSDILPELFASNVIIHSSAPDTTGLDGVRQTVNRVHAMFPDHHFTVDDIVVNGDKAAARWTMTATNTAPLAGIPPTGKPITQHAVVFYRFEDGKIAEFWVQMDQLGVLRQVGVQIPGMQTPSRPQPAQ
jgi:steroid delta-isomerase-like uncharacterized protein